MRAYGNDLKRYIRDLSLRSANPSGGSCAALSVCLGISLIQMALRYSGSSVSGYVARLEKIKEDVFPLVDHDGQLFQAIIKEKIPSQKKKLLKALQQETMILIKGCSSISRYCRVFEPSIKKTISSDFYAGLGLCRVALSVCITNLKANQSLFKINNQQRIRQAAKTLGEFKRWA